MDNDIKLTSGKLVQTELVNHLYYNGADEFIRHFSIHASGTNTLQLSLESALFHTDVHDYGNVTTEKERDKDLVSEGLSRVEAEAVITRFNADAIKSRSLTIVRSPGRWDYSSSLYLPLPQKLKHIFQSFSANGRYIRSVSPNVLTRALRDSGEEDFFFDLTAERVSSNIDAFLAEFRAKRVESAPQFS